MKWNNSMHSDGKGGRFSVAQNIVARDYPCQKLARYRYYSRNTGPLKMVKKHGFQKWSIFGGEKKICSTWDTIIKIH